MMKLTREEAIANHRKMWNWIADETERVRRCIDPIEYFRDHGEDIPENYSYCCEYDLQNYDLQNTDADWCDACPLDFQHSDYCRVPQIFSWAKYARLAREIANLPERGDHHFKQELDAVMPPAERSAAEREGADDDVEG